MLLKFLPTFRNIFLILRTHHFFKKIKSSSKSRKEKCWKIDLMDSLGLVIIIVFARPDFHFEFLALPTNFDFKWRPRQVNLVGKKIEQIALRRGRQMFNYVCQRLDRFNKVPINFFPIAESDIAWVSTLSVQYNGRAESKWKRT